MPSIGPHLAVFALVTCFLVTQGASAREALDRGMVARGTADGKVYVGWRVLKSDPPDMGFNVYRQADAGQPKKLNAEPLSRTSDFVDGAASPDARQAWFVRPVVDGRRGIEASPPVLAVGQTHDKPYISIERKDKDATFQKVGIADLDGDRRYDFVLKGPNANIDPWHKYWKPSPDTYKLEAYRHDGQLPLAIRPWLGHRARHLVLALRGLRSRRRRSRRGGCEDGRRRPPRRRRQGPHRAGVPHDPRRRRPANRLPGLIGLRARASPAKASLQLLLPQPARHRLSRRPHAQPDRRARHVQRHQADRLPAPRRQVAGGVALGQYQVKIASTGAKAPTGCTPPTSTPTAATRC